MTDIPERWGGLSPPQRYVLLALRAKPRYFIGAGGPTTLHRGRLFGSYNIIWSLLHRGFIEQRKDGKWQLKSSSK